MQRSAPAVQESFGLAGEMLSLIAVFVFLVQASSESSETERSETYAAAAAAHGEELPELHAACLVASGVHFFRPRSHTSALSCLGMGEALSGRGDDDYEGTDFLFLVTEYSEHEKGQEN